MVESHLDKPTPEAIALAIGADLQARGAIHHATKWAKVMLASMVMAALDRSGGDSSLAALAICQDLAHHSGFNLVRAGWFADDERIDGRALPRRV